MKVIIAAAGTGGHINPGIAIANKIKYEEPESEIMFIGTKRGLEKDLVPRAGYTLKTIESYGISRSLTLKNIKRLTKTILSINEAKKIIKKFNPDIIIGTGGYICISVCLAAKKLKIPYVIHESNVLPGVATKMLSKNSAKILVGFNEAKERISNKADVYVTGTPTKIKDLKLSDYEIENKRKEINLNSNKPLVLVFGGSQGAESINKSLVDIIKQKLNKTYQIIWATGPKQYDIVKKELMENDINIDNLNDIKVMPYIYDMESIMNISDLIVSRSGAMTVTEIEKIGKAAIFIPYPHAAENHQEYNARILEKKGAARVILDKDVTAKKLNEQIENLTKEKDTLKQMGKIAKSLSIDDVEEKIYVEIKEVLIKEK